MTEVPEELLQRLRRHGQEHVLRFWPQLADGQRRSLLAQLQGVDLEQLQQLFQRRQSLNHLPPMERVQPVQPVRLESADAQSRSLGEEALRRGEVAALVVAGGQGSRLRATDPKGMFEIGPVSGKTLFQIHAEKVLAVHRKFGRPVPLLVMTSPATDAKTREFFARQGFFGLPAAEVFFFCQGTMPAVDRETGRLLLESHGSLALSPNGHGGVLLALQQSGLLGMLQERGIRDIAYFQVDNPLVKVADPLFLGHHRARQAEVSVKVLAKKTPEDRMGNLVLVDGRCCIIEYFDLPRELAHERDGQGKLRFTAGSPAIHIFDVDFLDRVSRRAGGQPFHAAEKKVPYINDAGQRVEPLKENALKFEMFIFDAFPHAERWVVVETSREDEFAPLKNASGPDSPETVQRALTRRALRWLEQAEVRVHGPGAPEEWMVEISPLLALGPEDLAGKLVEGLHVDRPLHLE
jgi:UDP-N-acetylglucosamine/UDP-N-acetylgalactosamine diphosphorylase